MTAFLTLLRPFLGPLVVPAALLFGWTARGLWDAPGHARALEAARASCAAEAKARADAEALRQMEILKHAPRPAASSAPSLDGLRRVAPGCRDCAERLPELRGAP